MNTSVVTQFQPSITEWLAAIGEIGESEAFRKEDNEKVERLEILYQTLGVPYERPTAFSARELWDRAPAFQKILNERGDELCAIRLVPKSPGLPKLRNRGLSIRECFWQWFLHQPIAAHLDDYTAFVCPHTDRLLWSAIFVVQKDLIFGEIVEGLHSQLTQGTTERTTYRFQYDFKNWYWSGHHSLAKQWSERMVSMLYVPDHIKRRLMEEQLGAKFTNEHLIGYFETTIWPGDQLFFIDYNRTLVDYIAAPTTPVTAREGSGILQGSSAYQGHVQGRVVIVSDDNAHTITMPVDGILVCDNTDIRYLPLMKTAKAIITNRGGILSHASIVARELKKPCIVGTQHATEVLQDGDFIEIDAEQGTVKLL